MVIIVKVFDNLLRVDHITYLTRVVVSPTDTFVFTVVAHGCSIKFEYPTLVLAEADHLLIEEAWRAAVT